MGVAAGKPRKSTGCIERFIFPVTVQRRVARDFCFRRASGDSTSSLLTMMDIPTANRKYTDDEKLHLLANLDIEGMLTWLCLSAWHKSHFSQLHIVHGSSSHGSQIASRTSICTKRARSRAYQNKSGI